MSGVLNNQVDSDDACKLENCCTCPDCDGDPEHCHEDCSDRAAWVDGGGCVACRFEEAAEKDVGFAIDCARGLYGRVRQ